MEGVIDLRWSQEALILHSLEDNGGTAVILWPDLRELRGLNPEPTLRVLWQVVGNDQGASNK